jgi:hypothetical protein
MNKTKIKKDNLKKFKVLWLKFNELKYELLFSFIAMILGIVIGFECENYRQNKSADNSTRVKIHYTYLESEYNIGLGKKLLDSYQSPDSARAYIMFLDYHSARSLLDDENIFNVLPHYKVSLVRSYIDAIMHVNMMNEKYINYLDAVNYKRTKNGVILRKKLKENIISFLATCYEMQQQLKIFFDDSLYDKEEIKKSELRIKSSRQKINEGKFKLEKELN